MEYQEFDRVKLKNGQVGTVMDAMGGVYAVNLCQYSGHLKCDFYAAQGAIL